MKTKTVPFTIKPFRNINGTMSFRVAGWLLGERIRKNFKNREDAIIERSTLQLKQAQANSHLRVTSTFLTEPQLREAEAAFTKLKDKPHALTSYLNFAFENHREPKITHPLADAVASYLAERTKDVNQKVICQRQHDAIRIELTLFQNYFPNHSVGELTGEKLLDYIRRGDAAVRTQNNRRATLGTFFRYASAQGWLADNPLAGIKRLRVAHCRGSASALTSTQVAELMAHVETIHGGALVPFFALCLFAGIRPDGEISKLPATDVRMENNAIIIEPWVSKVGMRRLVTIQPNLAAWLKAYPLNEYPTIPPKDKLKNLEAKLSSLRKQFKLGHDVLRHTFVSMHVAKFRSMGDTALQAGNSESIIRRHYLNVTTPQEAGMFFDILPRMCVVSEMQTQVAHATETTMPAPATSSTASTPRSALVMPSAPAQDEASVSAGAPASRELLECAA